MRFVAAGAANDRDVSNDRAKCRQTSQHRNTGKRISNGMPVASPNFASAGQSNGNIGLADFEVQSDGSSETVR